MLVLIRTFAIGYGQYGQFFVNPPWNQQQKQSENGWLEGFPFPLVPGFVGASF